MRPALLAAQEVGADQVNAHVADPGHPHLPGEVAALALPQPAALGHGLRDRPRVQALADLLPPRLGQYEIFPTALGVLPPEAGAVHRPAEGVLDLGVHVRPVVLPDPGRLETG